MSCAHGLSNNQPILDAKQVTAAKVERVAADAAAKMRLERIFKPEIKSLFALIARDFRASVAATGQQQDGQRYITAWDAALTRQYNRTQRQFVGRVSESTGLEAAQQAKEILALGLLRWREDQSDNQAAIIANTTENDMASSLEGARKALVERRETVTNATLAAAGTLLLARAFASRVDSIATTETASAAESTKFMEAQVLSGTEPFSLGNGSIPAVADTPVKKMWITVGDSDVRASHVAVNGTRLSYDELFTLITGSKLRFPGDSGLNAAVADVINCRCSVSYER